MTVVIGTSGWQYRHWKPAFYPATLGSSKWFGFYSERFGTVEVNNTFYRLPTPSTFERWREAAPRGFVFALKASRYLTHVRRLKDPDQPVSTLMERASALGTHLGPILVQLPPNLQCDPVSLDATLSAFGARVRVAVELRHASWFVDDVRAVLESHGAALCLADGGPVEVPLWRTADWTYIRFHKGRGRPQSCYTRSALDTWAKRLAARWEGSEDVFCYFNNDEHACALRDARWLSQACARHGRPTTHVPPANEVKVG